MVPVPPPLPAPAVPSTSNHHPTHVPALSSPTEEILVVNVHSLQTASPVTTKPWQPPLWNHSIPRTRTMPLLERGSTLPMQLSITLWSALTAQPPPQQAMSAATSEHPQWSSNSESPPHYAPQPTGRQENTAASLSGPLTEGTTAQLTSSAEAVDAWDSDQTFAKQLPGKQQITSRASPPVPPRKSRRMIILLNCRACRSKTRLSCKPHARLEARPNKLASRTAFFASTLTCPKSVQVERKMDYMTARNSALPVSYSLVTVARATRWLWGPFHS